jgi:hypothetical protein
MNMQEMEAELEKLRVLVGYRPTWLGLAMIVPFAIIPLRCRADAGDAALGERVKALEEKWSTPCVIAGEEPR